MDEVELEKLVVRLVGDAQEFLKAMDEAKKKSKEVAEEVEGHGKKIEKVKDRIQEWAQAAVDAMIAFASLHTLKEALENWQEAEQISLKLTAALEANGRAVDSLREDYEEFGKALELTTLAEDDAVLKMLQMAESLGVTGEAAKRAVRNAIALAAQYDGVAESYIRMTAMLEQGKLGRLGMLLGMGEMEEGVDKIEEAQAKLEKMFKLAETITGSSKGQVDALKRDYANALEELGETVAEVFNPVIEVAREVVAWFRALPEPVKIATVAVIALVAASSGLAAVFHLVKTVGLAAKLLETANAAMMMTKTVLVLTAKVAAIGAMAYAFYKLGQAIFEADGHMENLNEEMAKNASLQDKITQRFVDESEQKLDYGMAMSKSGERRDYFKAELEEAKKQAQSYAYWVANAEKNVEELNSRWKRWTGNKVLEAANNELKQAQEQLKLAQDRVSAFAKAYGDAALPENNKELNRSIKETVSALEESIGTYGMSAEEAKLWKFEQLGATDAMLAELRALTALKSALDEDKEAREKSAAAARERANSESEFTRELADSIAFHGMSADAIKLHKLAMEGMNPLNILVADGLMKQKEALEKRDKALERAGEITKQNMTPLEQYKQATDELNELFTQGAISEGTWSRALDSAEKQYNDLTEKALEARDAVSGVDAALFGTAEANARIAEFKELLDSQMQAKLESKSSNKVEFVQRQSIKEQAAQTQTVDVLKLILGVLRDPKPTITVTPANVEN